MALLANASLVKVLHISIQPGQWIDTVFKYQKRLHEWDVNGNVFLSKVGGNCEEMCIRDSGGTDYIEGVMADPLTGLLWDLNVNYDKCNYRWTFQWKLEWDIFVMPPAVCDIPGVNGIFHFTTCPAVQYTCPDGGTPATPASSHTYEWNTNCLLYTSRCV